MSAGRFDIKPKKAKLVEKYKDEKVCARAAARGSGAHSWLCGVLYGSCCRMCSRVHHMLCCARRPPAALACPRNGGVGSAPRHAPNTHKRALTCADAYSCCLLCCCAGPDKDDQCQQRVQRSQQGAAVRRPPGSGEGPCAGPCRPEAEGQAGQSSRRQGAELAGTHWGSSAAARRQVRLVVVPCGQYLGLVPCVAPPEQLAGHAMRAAFHSPCMASGAILCLGHCMQLLTAWHRGNCEGQAAAVVQLFSPQFSAAGILCGQRAAQQTRRCCHDGTTLLPAVVPSFSCQLGSLYQVRRCTASMLTGWGGCDPRVLVWGGFVCAADAATCVQGYTGAVYNMLQQCQLHWATCEQSTGGH